MRKLENMLFILLMIILLVIILLLSSCKGSPLITKHTALKQSKFYNVICVSIRQDDKKPEIHIVGKNLNKYCPDNKLGCYNQSSHRIFVIAYDWKVINHELLHHYCENIGHKNK